MCVLKLNHWSIYQEIKGLEKNKNKNKLLYIMFIGSKYNFEWGDKYSENSTI